MIKVNNENKNEEKRRNTLRELISLILQAAFKMRDLKTFLDEIVKIGADKLEAKSCAIFLLEEPEKGERGRKLRAYAASGEVGKTLVEKKACYYVPEREPFKEKGEGRVKVESYLECSMDILRKEKSLLWM
ncbi:MAG: hypothetical protein QXV37_00730 [Candidatus Jordarchaeaceae archaeon]